MHSSNSGTPSRRSIHYATVDDMLADARSLAVATELEQLGNWTLGQAFNHIAAWIEFPYVGFPPELVIPSDMRENANAVKERLMTAPMAPGERLPGLAAGTLATEVVTTAVGLARLEHACKYLTGGRPTDLSPFPDPAFGHVTRHEWTEINLRHAELHLSFYVDRSRENG